MRFVQEIEFRPLGHGQETIFWVAACPLEGGLVPSCQLKGNLSAPAVDRLYQLFRRLVQKIRKEGVFFCYVTFEYGAAFSFDPPDPVEKYGLIGRQVCDIFKGAPFAGVGVFF